MTANGTFFFALMPFTPSRSNIVPRAKNNKMNRYCTIKTYSFILNVYLNSYFYSIIQVISQQLPIFSFACAIYRRLDIGLLCSHPLFAYNFFNNIESPEIKVSFFAIVQCLSCFSFRIASVRV